MNLGHRVFVFGELALVLVDVQGAFDHGASQTEDATIAALTLLCASKIVRASTEFG
jgi:hypothetical protein